MATWRCYSQHGMYYVDSKENPSNDARQCVMESGDPGEVPDEDFHPAVRLPPIVQNPGEVLGLPYREPGLSVASVPVFRDPVGPTPEDPYSDPTMAEVVNPPSSPTTNLLQGPWNGKLTLSANKGIDPKFDFGASASDDMTADDPWKKALSYWPWFLGAAVAYYLWRKSR